MVNTLLGHLQDGIEQAGVDIDVLWLRGHDLVNGRVQGQALGQGATAQVPIGEDAAQAILLHYQHRGHPPPGHGQGGLLQRRPGCQGQWVAAHQAFDGQHHHIGIGLITGGTAQATAALTVEMAIEVAELGA